MHGTTDRTGSGTPAAAWSQPGPWRVTDVRSEAPDVVTLALSPSEPFRFAPGQFNMVGLPGIGEVPISISGDPARTAEVLHTIRDVGLVTKALCGVRPGQRVAVRGPYGTSWPLEAAAGGDLVFVAGGIGLPPLRPGFYQALGDRDRFGRIILLYGARTPADLLFDAEVAAWRSRFDLDVEVTVDAADGDWHGEVGVVPSLIAKARFDPPNATAFVVGPEIMMRFTVRALLAAGMNAARIYLSMERNMQCAAGLCGHCQFGPFLVCRDGPVFSYQRLARWLAIREL
jgi:NAD(P)H-flavin reductase